MFYVHNLNPIALTVMDFPIRWYGISYIVSYFIACYIYPFFLNKKYCFKKDKYIDLITYGLIAALIGGRIGHVLGYELDAFLHNPVYIFKVWQGGMSFHGGLLGVIIFCYFFAKKSISASLQLLDIISLCIPSGVMLGRVANFINAELVGVPTDQTWGVYFYSFDNLARHPVQLYESFLEGFVIGLCLILILLKTNLPKRPGAICSIMSILYAIARIICEFWRVPDGLVKFFGFSVSLGQFYSIPLLFVSTGLLFYALLAIKHQENNPASQKKVSITALT